MNWLPKLVVAFIRNTPLIVQLVFIYTLFSMNEALIRSPRSPWASS